MTSWNDHDGCVDYQTWEIANGYTFQQWHSCECLYTVDYYLTEDGGHSWPGGNGTAIGDDPSEVINANDLMWEFFQSHSNDCLATSVEEKPLEYRPLHLYPNPSNHHITIVSEIPSEIYAISVISSQGKVMDLPLPTRRTDGIKRFVQIQLVLETLDPGPHVVRVDSEAGSFTKRFIVVR
jgi:hypothetical protein